jgi:hypothetical protein
MKCSKVSVNTPKHQSMCAFTKVAVLIPPKHQFIHRSIKTLPITLCIKALIYTYVPQIRYQYLCTYIKLSAHFCASTSCMIWGALDPGPMSMLWLFKYFWRKNCRFFYSKQSYMISRKTPIFWLKLAKIAKISDHNIDPRSAHPSELWVSVTKDVLTLVAKQTPLQNVNTARIRLRIFSKTFFSRADCCRTDQSSFTAGAEAHAIDICASFISGSSST